MPGDYLELAEALAPPEASEASRIEGESSVHISWNTTVTMADLEGYYEDRFAALGLGTPATLEGGTLLWAIQSESPPVAGSLQVMDRTDGAVVTVLSSSTG
jgi:hypothetical protein